MVVLSVGAHIMVMPPHAIIIGMPPAIMFIMPRQHSMNMSFMLASMGSISQVMPVGVMVQVILHIIIGIIPPIIGMGIMDIGIMPFIIMGDIIPPIGIDIGICIIVGIGMAFISASPS